MLLPSAARGQRLIESRFGATPVAGPLRPANLFLDTTRTDTEPARPHAQQAVVGYMGAILIGFLAWRAFDEPAGQHSRVQQDWGYTPDAHTAFGIGSFVGATLGVWGTGRKRGATGTLLSTAVGAAIPTVWILSKRDDPMLPFVGALFGAPLQGMFAYVGYKATAGHARAPDNEQ